MPTPEEVARAFDLGTPAGGLVHVRRGDADTWRLDTSTGRYFVKGYFPAAGVHVTDQLAAAMVFERHALAAGIDMPKPIPPTDPLLGWVARIEDRLFRVYRWIDHQTPEPDISAWLGRTMLQVHQLQPLDRAGLPQWWRHAVQPPETWEGWFAEARHRDAAWAGLQVDSLPHVLAVSARIAELCDVVPDLVTTHGDFKIHNVVMSPSGPVLVDWDSVRTDSAALEAGRSAYIFGGGEPKQVKRILTAYVAAGGDLGWAGADLFLSVARNVIQVLGEQIRVSLGETTAARWMGDRTTIETTIGSTLRDLPGKLDHLHQLATQTLD
ncbi:phosphotransferase enzyme family protein [Kribbella soli]|uniref:Aminoglycoside phosphotransferase family protein n=1 Tax=Kribbella soli TaxID=1124743 RepID=A0A4R0HUB0_9ACTN|nr:aminoglycoside phosphotransferase family protein [Kribbella soli]TCC11479.1 aminoglycoside phosphotransferase family protein [Kribbella soli]